jgi:hypothetical protein
MIPAFTSLISERRPHIRANLNSSLTDLRPPKPDQKTAPSPENEQREQIKRHEPNPSHFAPENPTNKELAKERWYARAACASMIVGYSTALLAIKYGEGEFVPRGAITGLFLEALFSYWALRNSELRTYILDGSVLPNPSHSDMKIRRLLTVGSFFHFLGSITNIGYSAELFTDAQHTSAIFRAAFALSSLHLGFAWWRRVRFFGSIDAQ